MVKEFKQKIKEDANALNSFNFHIDYSADLVSLEARIKRIILNGVIPI
jgi:hypothetical protein